MSRWEPHTDLMRLLEALANEIVSTPDQEVRQMCAEDGWSTALTAELTWSAWPELQVEARSSMARTAEEVRELVDAVNGDPGELEIDVEKGDIEKGDIELRGSRHLQSVVERGSRTCHKQH
jgi:NTP pyrophosphatase (non-canonical NTP hydrolase)